jgi:hypothetical protein
MDLDLIDIKQKYDAVTTELFPTCDETRLIDAREFGGYLVYKIFIPK